MQTGIFRAKVVSSGVSQTKDGKPTIAVVIRCFNADETESFTITYNGYLSEKAHARTLDSLKTMGYLFQTENMSDLAENKGFDKTVEFEADIQEEIYDGKTQIKVKWINPIGGQANKFMLSKDEAVTKLEGLNIGGMIANFRQNQGLKTNVTPEIKTSDIPF
jgi:hypothetical protein